MTCTYKVTYFPGKGGGEIIRLALSAAGQEFEDERIAREDWPKLKPSTPMKAMPVLTITQSGKSTVYCQSGSIAKYIAKKYGQFGTTPEEELLIDEVFESLVDTQREMIKVMYTQGDEAKKEAEKKFAEEVAPKFAEYFKKRQTEFGQNGFIIGPKMTLADIHVFNFVDQTSSRGYGHLWEKYPELKKHENLIKSQETIAAWLAKRPASEF